MMRNSGRALQSIAQIGIARVVLVLGLLAAGPVQAVVCSITGSTIFPNAGTCAEVSAQVGNRFGGSAGTPIPPNYAYSPSGGTANVIAGGQGGEATATASAQPGTLRLTTRAQQGDADPTAYAQANATAAFADVGIIELAGGTLGDPVTAIVTISIEGTTFGQAFLNDAHFNFSSLREGNLENNFGVDFPQGVYQFSAHVGDEVLLSLGFSIDATGSTINGFPLSFAEYGNSAHLYFDFLESGVSFQSNSGHDYSSAAVVPAPPAVWLLGTALTGLGGRRWLRRKVSSQLTAILRRCYRG
jgi:hypothetical protein